MVPSSAIEVILEGRNDVNAGRAFTRLVHQAARQVEPDLLCIRPRVSELLLDLLRNRDPGHLVVEPERELEARQRPNADEQGDRRLPAQRLEEAIEVADVEERLGHAETGTRLELLPEAFELGVEILCGRVDRDADVERGRRVDRLARVVLALVQAGHQTRQPDGVDLVHAARAGVVAYVRRVTGHGEDVANPGSVGSEELGLEAHHGGVARRHVRDRLEAHRSLDLDRGHERGKACTGHRVVVDVRRVHGA
jgi:hypothetical protein